MKPVEILIADDHQLFRECLRTVFDGDPSFHICAEASDGLEAVKKAADTKPEVALLDVSMPRMNGLEAARLIRRERPDCKIVIISQNDPKLMERAAGEVGAAGFIPKSRISQDLLRTLHTVLSNGHDGELAIAPASIGLLNVPGAEVDKKTSHKAAAQTPSDPASQMPNLPEHFERLLRQYQRRLLAETEQERERFHQILNSMPAAIYCTDAEGRLTYFNRAAAEFSGRVPKIGEDQWCVTWKLFYPDGKRMRHEDCPMAIALKEGRPVYGQEAIAERPDGSRAWFMPYPTPLRDNDGNIIGGINILVDITENKKQDRTASLLAAIVDSSDDAIISKDLNGYITSWNKSAERIFGYKAEEAVGKHITLIIPRERRKEEDEIIARIRRGERVDHFETMRVRKDGTKVEVSLAISPVKDSTGRVIGASKVARDITETKRGERSNGLLAAIVDSSDDAIVSKDLNSCITSWNKSAERIFGYTADEAVGKHITLIIPPERLSEEDDIIGRIRRGERVDHFDTVRRHKDGTHIDVSLTISPVKNSLGRVIGASKVARDVTEKKQLERVLRDREERFRAFFEQTNCGIAEVDITGRYVLVNDHYCEMVGRSREELKNLRMQDILHADDVLEGLERFQALTQGGENFVIENRCIRGDGTPVWVRSRVFGVRGVDGKIESVTTMSAAIENEKRTQLALANAARQQIALFHLADRLHRAHSSEEVYAAALSAICEAVQCDRASILLFDESNTMRFVAWRGLSDGYRKAVEGHSPWKADEPDPQPVCVSDAAAAELSPSLKTTVESEGIRSLAFIPLVFQGRLVGKFMAYFPAPHRFSAEELDLSMTVARQLAFAVERIRGEEALRQSEERFRRLSESLDAEVRLRTAELEQRNAEVVLQSDALRELSRRLLLAQDEERRHIARELHDSAGQTLTVLGITLAQLAHKIQRYAPEAMKQLDDGQELVQQLHREIRTTSYLLHPPLLDESGLSSALSWYVQGLVERSGIDIQLEISPDFGRLPREMELVAFRVVQECLTNIHRHSSSKQAIIRALREPEMITIDIQDRGQGMSSERLAEVQAGAKGVGIRGMRERLRQFDGHLSIDSGRFGTRVLVTIPIQQTVVQELNPPEPLKAAV